MKSYDVIARLLHKYRAMSLDVARCRTLRHRTIILSYSPTTPLARPLDAGRANICCRPGHRVSAQDNRLAAALNVGRHHVTPHAGNRPRNYKDVL